MDKSSTITAWKSDGKGTVKLEGPIYPEMLDGYYIANPWTKDDIAYLRDHLGIKTNPEIGQFLGRSGDAVWHKADYLGLHMVKEKTNR